MATGGLLSMMKLQGEGHVQLKINIKTFQCEQRPPTSPAITDNTHKTPSHVHETVGIVGQKTWRKGWCGRCNHTMHL